MHFTMSCSYAAETAKQIYSCIIGIDVKDNIMFCALHIHGAEYKGAVDIRPLYQNLKGHVNGSKDTFFC